MCFRWTGFESPDPQFWVDASYNVVQFPVENRTIWNDALRLWVSMSVGTDLDLFVKLRKFDAAGREVFFYGYNGFAETVSPRAGCVHRIERLIRNAAVRECRGIRTSKPISSSQVKSLLSKLRS